jgi:hypothetical protein
LGHFFHKTRPVTPTEARVMPVSTYKLALKGEGQQKKVSQRKRRNREKDNHRKKWRKMEDFESEQGDQIGRIFAQWPIVCFEQF